jgi:hypothetical protein
MAFLTETITRRVGMYFTLKANAISGPMHCALGCLPVTNIICVKITNRPNIVRRFTPTQTMQEEQQQIFFADFEGSFGSEIDGSLRQEVQNKS